VEWPVMRCYVGLVAVGVQEQAGHTCSAAATKLFDFELHFFFLWPSDLIHRKVSWHALAKIPLVITSSLLEISTCPGLRR